MAKGFLGWGCANKDPPTFALKENWIMAISKQYAGVIDAIPSKRLYRSIIADYDLNTAICELVDNAIDVWTEKNNSHKLTISIEIDTDPQKIVITDNAGGVEEDELKKLIAPGESTMTGTEKSIGIFGVGSKRSVVALAKLIRITTRYQGKKTFRVEYDDEWLNSSDWHVNYELVENIPPNTTKVELSDLRFRVEDENIEKLCSHLSETYAYFLRDKNIQIQVTNMLNERDIEAKFFENWAYPPEYEPQRFKKTLRSKDHNLVELEIIAGMVNEKGNLTDYGVYFYCNKRMISKAIRVPEVGFISGVAGSPHHTMCLARIFVKIEGPSDCMPWTSNKAGIHYNHWIFQALRNDIIEPVKTYAHISKRLHKSFNESVLPYDSGQIKEIVLSESESIKPNRLPAIPKTRKDFKSLVLELNKALGHDKPWTRGLYESIIAEGVVAGQTSLSQKNRISLIVLDSTLEIAFKDYLAFGVKNPLGDDKLRELFENRTAVHQEVSKHLFHGQKIWQQIEYFYKLRCDLIHKRTSALISDDDLNDFRCVVKKVLSVAFKIQFP